MIYFGDKSVRAAYIDQCLHNERLASLMQAANLIARVGGRHLTVLGASDGHIHLSADEHSAEVKAALLATFNNGLKSPRAYLIPGSGLHLRVPELESPI